MNKVYIRKGKSGWRVVSKSTMTDTVGTSTTVIAPLKREDAVIMRDTFKRQIVEEQ